MTQVQLLKDRFRAIASPRILVVGDLMLDEYVWGDVSRISPEAPVPVVSGRHRELKAGGAGSVVENLAVLGADVLVCGLIGDDAAGRRFAELLAAKGVSDAGLITCDDRVTTRKVRVMASVQQAHRAQQQVCRIDWEDAEAPNPLELQRIESTLAKLFDREPEVVLVSDYEKGLLSPQVLACIFELCAKRGVPALVDPGRTVDYGRYRGAHLLCPNRFEAECASGITLRSTSDFEACGRHLIEAFDLECVALTLDREGIFFAARDGRIERFPTQARAVADVAGAGDMVLSLIGLGLSAGWAVDDAIRLANIGAGIEVSKVGVTPIERWELEAALPDSGEGTGEQLSVVRSAEEIERIAARERAAGRRVVFANGCFDILHAGHIKLLEKARSFGDMLILGLNSDASVRRLKGDQRPIVSGENRALVLSALPYVDHVVFFADDTPLALIERIRPDILVKGSDYEGREVVGREIVERHGGRVELVDLRPEISTTVIVERIRRAEQRADGNDPG